MHQRRICEYFGLTCTHNRTFLCLPLTVRLQVYREAALYAFGNNSVDLNWRPEASPFQHSSDQTIINLLSTCRTVYTELSSSFYSTKRFFIRYRKPEDLQSLKRLSSSALAAIRHLTVQLNITTTDPGTPCCPAYELIANHQICIYNSFVMWKILRLLKEQ
jgi:hypothetical protein